MPRETKQPPAADSMADAPEFHEIDWDLDEGVKDEVLVSFITREATRGKARREEWEQFAAEQLAWVRGDQHVEKRSDVVPTVTAERHLLDLLDMPDIPLRLRQPVQVNVLRRFVTVWLSMLVSDDMTFTASPATDEDGDVDAARIQERLLQYYWHSAKPSNFIRLVNALWLVFTTGFAGLKFTWDPYGGELQRLRATTMGLKEGRDDKVFRKLLAKKMNTRADGVRLNQDGSFNLAMGDVSVEVVNGFDITEPAESENINESDWLIHTKLRSRAYVKTRYGVEDSEMGHLVQPADGPWRQVMDLLVLSNYRARNDNPKSVVPVHELWVPAGGVARRGYRAVLIGRKIYRKGVHPDMHGLSPIVFIAETPDPVNSRPGSVVRDLMGLARARNRLRSEQIAHHTMKIVPKFIAEKNVLPKDALDDIPSVVEVADGAVSNKQIMPLEIPDLPAESYRLDQSLDVDMQNVAGVHRNTMGTRESAQQSGRHAALMLEQDQRAHSLTAMMLRTAARDMAHLQLWLIYQYVDEERALLITGKHRRREVLKYKGKDLAPFMDNGAPFRWNVTVDLGVRPDLSASIDQINALSERGWLQPQNPEHQRMVWRFLGTRGPGFITDEFEVDRSNAAEENEAISFGKEAIIHVWPDDNDAIHLEEHERYAKSQQFRQKASKSMEVFDRMDLHLRHHRTMMIRKALKPRLLAEQQEIKMRADMGLSIPVPEGPGQAGGAARKPAEARA